mgnify:CR=1 FL=1
MSSSNKNNTNVVENNVKMPNTNPNHYTAPEMDNVNKEGAKIWNDKGKEAAVEFMFTKPDGTPRSYADMRMMFG